MKIKLFKLHLIAIILFGKGFVHGQMFIADPQGVNQFRSFARIEDGNLDPTEGSTAIFNFPKFIDGTMSGGLELDLDANRLVFQRISIDFGTINMSGEFTYTDAQTNTVTRTITGSITFQPIEFLDTRRLALEERRTEGEFNVQNFPRFTGNRLPNTSTNRLIGTYEFSGPTETVSGDFSHASPIWQRWNSPRLRLDASDPDNPDPDNPSVMIFGNPAPVWLTDTDIHLFNGMIDDIPLNIVVSRVEVGMPDDFEFDLFIIPEPSTYALVSGLLMIAFSVVRRMHLFSRIRQIKIFTNFNKAIS